MWGLQCTSLNLEQLCHWLSKQYLQIRPLSYHLAYNFLRPFLDRTLKEQIGVVSLPSWMNGPQLTLQLMILIH